jgi:hypothetical protein
MDNHTVRGQMMKSMPLRGPLGAFATLALALSAQAQDRNAPTIEARLSDPVYMAWVSHQDVEACISCHYAGPNVAQVAGGQSNLTAFSRRQELEFWLAEDKHTIARRRVEPFDDSRTKAELEALIEKLDRDAKAASVRLNEAGIRVDTSEVGLTEFPEEWIGESNFLSRRMCDKLGYNVETAEGYGKFRDNCLTCHGGYQQGDEGFDLASVSDAQLGISCLYCHQLGDNSKWVAQHAAPQPEQNWRLLPPEQKAAAGMRHLVGVSAQGDLCFDCHVGNREKNMFVTHEMYAAGHPPIPSIELQTFCNQMPQHWQTPSELYENLKDYAGRDQYFAINYPGVADQPGSAAKTFWNTRNMLVGALTARRKALDLIIDSASNREHWADYSLYDCAACHHELESSSVRQQRGYPAAPGRPRQHEWPSALLKIAYVFYGKQTLAMTRSLESRLEAEFGEQPFGDPARVLPAAEALRQQVVAALAEVEQKPVDVNVACGVLKGLARTPKEELMTYDSARQVVWAMQTIADELEAEGAPLPEPVALSVRALGDGTTAGVTAKLPAGRQQFIFADELRADLERRAQYNPAVLAARLSQLNQMLAALPGPTSTLVNRP